MPYHHGNLREVLLAKAEEAIEQEGIAALSLRDLARRAGVSHAAPAHHFGDKAGLLTNLATRAMDRFRENLACAAEAPGTERERLRAMGRAYVRFASEHPALFCIITRSEFIRRGDPDFAASHQATFERVKSTVIAAQREGWARDEDPMVVAIAIWSTAHGLATLWLDGVLEDRIGPVDVGKLTESVFELLTAG